VQGVCPELDHMTGDKTPAYDTAWYAYSDRTCPLSCPPVFVDDAGGTLTPQEGEPFPPVDGGPTFGGHVWPYREVSGGGESNWGVGFGFDFQDVPGTSPVAHCPSTWCEGNVEDAGDEDSGMCKADHYALQTKLYDASQHLGISFWARWAHEPISDGTPLPLTLHISDVHTADVGYAYIDGGVDGGACNPCLLHGGTGACGDDFLAPVLITPSWAQHVVFFTALKQNGFSNLIHPIDLHLLGHVNFEVQTTMGVPLPEFAVQVAYVEWVDWISE
jgi:hypothetical protein